MKKKPSLFMKVVEEVTRKGVEMGMNWQSKVYLRCAVEGCRYGIEGIDKAPSDTCMYCGNPNTSSLIRKFKMGSIENFLKEENAKPKTIK